jgi:hypothetical protein
MAPEATGPEHDVIVAGDGAAHEYDAETDWWRP